MKDLRKKYFKPAKLHHYLDNGSIGIEVIDGGYGYIGDVKLEFFGGLPDEKANYDVIVENGVITGTIVGTGGEGYKSLPILKITPNQYKLDWSNFSASDIQKRPIAFYTNSLDNLPDDPNAKIGAKINLSTSAFDIKWDDLKGEWDDFSAYGFKQAKVKVTALDPNTGELVGLEIEDPGQNYILLPSVEIIGGDPDTPAIIAELDTSNFKNGQLDNIELETNGSGYKSIPEIRLTGGMPIGDYHTWDTLGYGNYYEMEWRVYGPRKFKYKKRGSIVNLENHEIILPYIGKYDVELILYDTANTVTNLYKNDFIEVQKPNVDFGGIYRHLDKIATWNDFNNNWSWDNTLGTWLNPMKIDNKWNDLKVPWEDSNIHNYMNINTNYIPISQKYNITDLNEADEYIGIVYSQMGDGLLLKNTQVTPAPKIGDKIYLRYDKNVVEDEILDISDPIYTNGIESLDINKFDNNSPVNDTFAIEYNHETQEFVNNNILPNYEIEEIEDTIFYEKPEIATSIIGKLDDINIGENEVGFIGWVHGFQDQEDDDIKDFIAEEILYENGGIYYLQCYITTDLNGEEPIIDIEIGDDIEEIKENLIAIVGYEGNKSAVLEIPNGANIEFEGDFYYSFPPNIVGIISMMDNSPPEEIILKGFKTTELPKITSKLECKFEDINGIIINPGKWLSHEPVFIDTNLNHTINTVLNKDVIDFIIEINHTNLVHKNWEVLKKLNNTIYLDKKIKKAHKNKYIKITSNKKVSEESIDSFNVDEDNFINIKIIIDKVLNLLYNQKLYIYRKDELNFTTTQFTIIPENNKIILENVSEDLFNINDELIINKSRFIIKEKVFDYEEEQLTLILQTLDKSLNYINENDSTLTIHYHYDKFIAKIFSSEIVADTTEILLNFNYYNIPPGFLEKFKNPDIENWYFKYNFETNNDGVVEVLDIKETLDNKTQIVVNDLYGDLWKVGLDSKIQFSEFDFKEVRNQLGINNINWNNLKNSVTWNTLENFNWDMFVYNFARVCTFNITKVEQGGTIKWNEETPFQFNNLMEQSPPLTHNDMIEIAADELKNTDHKAMSKFSFNIKPGPPSFYNLRVPTISDWNDERDSWNTEDDDGAFESPLKLTVAGFRLVNTGAILNIGEFGHYWSRTIDGDQTKWNFFSSNNTGTFSIARGMGGSVRLIVDGEYTQQQYDDNYKGQTFEYNGNNYGFCYNPTTNRIWLDRNLGASQVANAKDDNDAYGDLYQWGRGPDGHEKRDSNTTTILSDSDIPGHSDFILTSTSPRDWRSPKNDNLWQDKIEVAYYNNNYIEAIAKLPGSDALGYLEFGYGVEGEYVDFPTISHTFPKDATLSEEWKSGIYDELNEKPDWDYFFSIFNKGVDPNGNFGWYPLEELNKVYYAEKDNWKAQQIPFLKAVSGDINNNEIRYFNESYIEVPQLTTVLFSDLSNIKGKVDYVWEIFKDNKKIIEYKNKYFAWVFAESGEYDIKLTITDNFGNKSNLTKNGMINVK